MAYSAGCGPRPNKGFVHRLQFFLKLAEVNLILNALDSRTVKYTDNNTLKSKIC